MLPSEILRRDYPDIIQSTVHMYPENYDVILLEEFLKRQFPNLSPFISMDTVVKIKTDLKLKFGNHDSCIKEHGFLKKVKITELRYFQPTVGISGAKHSTMDLPVYVVSNNGTMILFNGYHRTLVHILNEVQEIEAYVLNF